MTRYFIYSMFMCMILQTYLYVPSILISHRFEGALPSIFIAIALGSLFIYIFTQAMSRFPGQGLPEIMRRQVNSWIRMPFLIFFTVMWFSAGCIVAIAFSYMVHRFILPKMSHWIVIVLLVLVSSWGASRNTKTVLYVLEIITWLSFPLMIFMIVKAVFNRHMDWDAVRTLTDYVFRRPSLSSLSAAGYIFTGYVNFAILNRAFENSKAVKLRWAVILLGTVSLFSLILIPIGINGTYGVGDYTYPVSSTMDSLRLEYGFTDRLLYTYLIVYLDMSFLFVTVTWHVGAELLKSCFSKKAEKSTTFEKSTASVCIMIIVSLVTILLAVKLNERKIVQLTSAWLEIRLLAEVLLVALTGWLAYRRKPA